MTNSRSTEYNGPLANAGYPVGIVEESPRGLAQLRSASHIQEKQVEADSEQAQGIAITPMDLTVQLEPEASSKTGSISCG